MQEHTDSRASKRPVLLGVFAHPDDESYGAGGTLARYAAEGIDVYVVIATDGAAGVPSTDGEPIDGQRLAEIRAAELAAATSILGVKGFWNLGYHDSGMQGSPDNQHPQALIQQPLSEVADKLVDLARRLRPQVVVTHDPFGGYGHPDHIRVSEATTAAFQTLIDGPAEFRPKKLYYTAFDRRSVKFFVKVLRFFGQDPSSFGRNNDIDLVAIAENDLPISARIDTSDYGIQRNAAIRAHASQYSESGGVMRVLSVVLERLFSTRETYSRSYPPPSQERETDLFAGIELG